MTELVYLPPGLLRRRMGAQPELMRRVRTSGVTESGLVPAIATDGGGLWQIVFDDVHLRTDDSRKAWRAINALSDGGANKLIVPLCDGLHQPWPLVNNRPLRSYGTITHSDDTIFSDGTGYTDTVIDAQVVGTFDLRASSIVIQFNYGGPPEGGEHFSIDHPTLRHRLYRIGRVAEEDDGTYTCTIRPPLREAITDATRLEFDLPKLVAQPDPPNALDLAVGTARGPARISPKFIEAFV